jgi:hypothetical protein
MHVPTPAVEASEPSMADAPHTVHIATNGCGAAVTVDGADLSTHLRGYTLEQQVGQPALLVLYRTQKDAPAHFEGLARVVVGETAAPADDDGAAIAAFLSNVDPAALENAALNRDDLGGERYDLTRAMLRQLADWSQGKG